MMKGLNKQSRLSSFSSKHLGFLLLCVPLLAVFRCNKPTCVQSVPFPEGNKPPPSAGPLSRGMGDYPQVSGGETEMQSSGMDWSKVGGEPAAGLQCLL